MNKKLISKHSIGLYLIEVCSTMKINDASPLFNLTLVLSEYFLQCSSLERYEVN